MAKLENGFLALEICFTQVDVEEWLHYHVRFLFNGEPMINDSLLKRWGPYWGSRPPGTFLVNDHQGDSLIPKIQVALDTDQPVRWTPIEPDMSIAIRPGQLFSYLQDDWELVYMSEQAQQELETYEMTKGLFGKLPSDSFSVIAMIDAYNFGTTSAYYGQGLALILTVTRQQLQEFHDALKSELDPILPSVSGS